MTELPGGGRRRKIEVQTGAGAGIVTGIELGRPHGRLDILFLHANGFNALTYRAVFAELHPSLRLLAVDLRGHGGNTLPVPDPHPGWLLHAGDLVALIAALGEAPRIVAGHSMGGATALLAAPRLEGVERLMLFDPVVPAATLRQAAGGGLLWDTPFAQGALRRRAAFASREEAYEAYEGRGAFRTWQDAMLRDYIEDGLVPAPDGGFRLACSPAWEAANFASYGVADPLAGFGDGTAAVMIFKAAHGSTCGVELEDVPRGARRRVRIEVLPGTSHFIPMERPGIVCRALLEALS